MQEEDLVKQIANYLHLSDTKIGKLFGKSEHAIYRLRKKYGLEKKNVFREIAESNGFKDYEYGWLKTEHASIFIKKEENVLTYTDIRQELIDELKRYAPKYTPLKRPKLTDKHLLVIDPADVHIGKLALKDETGEDYNIETAVRRCIAGVEGILQKAQGFPIDKILLVIGNDVLHIDTPFRKTTSGTPQDTDGQWWQAFLEAKKMYVQIVERLVQVADVEVIYCPSNHDYASGFMLADTLSSWFAKHKNVSFSVDIKHRKYTQYGLNMLAFDHGDGCKEASTKDLMADEAPQMWGATKYRYAFKHHIHHKRRLKYQDGEDYIGVTVEYLRSPSASDGWHNRNGFVAPKAVEGFILSKDKGMVARLTHYF